MSDIDEQPAQPENNTPPVKKDTILRGVGVSVLFYIVCSLFFFLGGNV